MKPELVDPTEWSSIERQIDKDFGKGTTNSLLGTHAPVIIFRGKSKSYYLIPSSWIQKIDAEFEGFDIRLMGQWFGEIVNDEFRPSLPIIEKLATLTHSKLVVSSRAAEALTYGRSILKESVVSIEESLSRGQKVIVLNEAGDGLGLASP